jgi:competence protein ComFC
MMRKCLICGGDTGALSPVCQRCFSKLNKVIAPFDEITGRPLKSKYEPFGKNHYFVRNRSYCVYDELSSKIIKEFKYNGHFRISDFIVDKLETLIDVQADFVVPVPAPVTTLISRGYNQSAILAKKLAKRINVEYLSPLISLKKSRQVGKSFVEREKNIRGTVIFKKKYQDLLKSKVVIIIDDVFTTGATLNEVSKVLKFAGAEKVFTFTFSITN